MSNSPREQLIVVDAEIVCESRPVAPRPQATTLQFSLAKQFVAVTLFGFLFALIANVGVGRFLSGALLAILVLIPFTTFALIWGLFYRFFPQPTKYASVLGLLILLPLTMLPCWMIRSREEARRTQCTDSLRKLYFDQRHSKSDLSESTPDNFAIRSGPKYPTYEP